MALRPAGAGTVWLVGLLLLGHLGVGVLPTHAAGPSYAPTLSGQVVRFGLRGLEPDFDPIDAVVLSLTLHDPRPAPHAYPDATLILDTYLETFQSGTMPLLPDVLAPAHIATGLGGFLQGKATLVSGAGRIAYSGSLLGEVFTTAQAHLVVDLWPAGVTVGPALRLRGVLTLRQGGTQTGTLWPVSAAALRGLAGRPGRAVPWQTVVADSHIALPPMRGASTGGAAPRTTPRSVLGPLLAPATRPPPGGGLPSRSNPRGVVAYGLAVLLVGLALLLWWRPRRQATPPRPPSA